MEWLHISFMNDNSRVNNTKLRIYNKTLKGCFFAIKQKINNRKKRKETRAMKA